MITSKQIDRILKCGSNYALKKWGGYKSSMQLIQLWWLWCNVRVTNSAVVWHLRALGLFLPSADTLQARMTCHHYPDRPTVAPLQHTQPANPISFPTMTPLRHRGWHTVIWWNYTHKRFWFNLSPVGHQCQESYSYMLIQGWQLIHCIQWHPPTKLMVLLYTTVFIILTQIFVMLTLLYSMLALQSFAHCSLARLSGHLPGLRT